MLSPACYQPRDPRTPHARLTHALRAHKAFGMPRTHTHTVDGEDPPAASSPSAVCSGDTITKTNTHRTNSSERDGGRSPGCREVWCDGSQDSLECAGG
jgi:hypothetical protein